MLPEQYRRTKAVFQQACQLPQHEREAFVRNALDTNPSLLDYTLRLLAAESSTSSGMIEAKPTPTDRAMFQKQGETIGPFQILRFIGAGGMGAVYEAKQDTPHRIVALKVIKTGITSPATPSRLRRFNQEIDALAKLVHPGIAHLLQSGTVESDGATVPYFAMELVRGVPLVEYAAASSLLPRRRLDLFLEVCSAVGYAHTKGIVHRDLKPDNILVTDDGRPKILDFGIARLIGAEETSVTMHTEAGQILGTPAYMSPEQARGNASAADTRTDVYSLGLILFELMSGRLPYAVRDVSLIDALKNIESVEPMPLGDLNPTCRGDVETIAAKALAKDPSRRYQSVSEMAEDIRRHLQNKTIAARPPSTVYQLRKFAKRHKAVVSGVAATFMALIIGLVAALWAFAHARASEARTRQALVQLELQEGDIYAAGAGVLKKMNLDELASMTKDKLTPREMAACLEQSLIIPLLDWTQDEEFKASPKLNVGFRAGAADLYMRLSMFSKAEPLLKEVIQILEGIKDSPTREYDIAANQVNLASCYRKTGRPELAEPLLSQAIVQLRLTTTAEGKADCGITLNTLARTRLALGQASAAEPIAREALSLFLELASNVEDEGCGRIRCTIGDCLLAQGRTAEAAGEYEHALAIPTFATLEPLADTAVQTKLAGIYISLDRLDDAERLLRSASDQIPKTTSASFIAGVYRTYAELFDARASKQPNAGHEQTAATWRERLSKLSTNR